MLAAMDDGIGRTLDALKTEGLDENTLVIFFNDNGGPTMPGTTINGASNGLLRGSKRQTWEGGIRVASVFRWTGRLPENKVERRPIIQLDVFPTALAAAGVAVQPHWKLDGVNLLPYLRGQRASAPHQALYWRLGEHMAIRKGDWKLVRTSERPLERVDSTAFADLSGAGLYNLAEDVGETNDLAKAYPQRVKELGAAWLKWNAELARPLWSPAGRGIAPTRQ
jgi:arylsulfatase A-like enzyme